MTTAALRAQSSRVALSRTASLALIALITCLVLTASLVRTSEGLSRGYQYSRQDLSHPSVSLDLAYSLAYCGQYSNSAGVVFLSELNTLKNDQQFSLGRSIDCGATTPSFAAENGFVIILAPALALGFDTPFELGVLLTVLKYCLIALAGAIAVRTFGNWLGVFLVVATLGWAYWDERYFYEAQLFLDFHVLEPYVWLLAALCSVWVLQTSQRSVIGWRHWVIVGLASLVMFFLRLLRSSDFYIQEVALALVAATATWFLIRDRRRLVVLVASVLTVAAVPMALGIAHARWLESRACSAMGGDPVVCARELVNVEHPIWHPVVLGLAVPPSPISERFGFEWAADSETLKPAQFINPDVDKLYTPEFSRALRDFYIHIWTQLPGETIATYVAKIGVLYNIGWPVVIFGFVGLVVGFWKRSLPTAFFSLLFLGKAMESTLIYPPYWSFYHQATGVLAIGVLIAAIGSRSLTETDDVGLHASSVRS